MFIIFIDPNLCVHHAAKKEKILKYKKDIEKGAIFPPIEVVVKNGRYLVLDGAHRVSAYKELGQDVLAMVYEWNDCPKRFLVGKRVSLVSV